MKYFYLLTLVVTLATTIHAQTATGANTDTTRVREETESYFPGGDAAWIKYLSNNLVYPRKAVRNKIEGTVVVQFIVEKNGTLSDIQAISGPELLQETAVNIIKTSPRWKPAMQDGRIVKSYKKQPISFRLQ